MRGLPVRTPAEARVGVLSGEKVIAWAQRSEAPDGYAYAAATNRAIYLGGERVPWHRVSKATWDEPVLTLVVADPDTGRTRVIRAGLEEARDLPAAVHDRVTDSVVVTERVELDDGAGALVVARRDSDDGTIHWTVLFDSGLDPTNAQLRAAADEALGRLRNSLGI